MMNPQFEAMHVSPATSEDQTGTIIFFHGSGSTGDSLREWVSMLSRKPFEFPHLKILYPTAPLQPYSSSSPYWSNVWFDLPHSSPQTPENTASLAMMSKLVKDLIKRENDLGIPTDRIIVGGFAMGGALALNTGYMWEKNLAGVFAFSSFLNDNSSVFKHLATEKPVKTPPLYQLHGDKDDLVWMSWGKNTFDNLTKLGVKGEFHQQVQQGHALDIKGLEMVREWIEKKLPEIEE